MFTRPFLYHVHDHKDFDKVKPQEAITLKVPPLFPPGKDEKKKFYSLKRDLDALRQEGVKKGIVDAAVTSVGKSHEGRELLALKVGKNPKQKVLFTGCHHAREWISVEVPYYVAEYLVMHYKSSPSTREEKLVKRIVDEREIWFVPMVNPDGHAHTIAKERLWRPNRRRIAVSKFSFDRHFDSAGKISPSAVAGGKTDKVKVKKGSYTGVDVNRNYPTKTWGTETAKNFGVKTSRDPNDSGANSIWFGPSGGSEPETKAIVDLQNKHSFRASITYHSFSQLLLFPDAAAADTFVQDVGKGMDELIDSHAKTVGGTDYTYQAGSALYDTTGDAMDFSYEKAPGRPTYTPELRPKDASDMDKIFNGLPEAEIEPCWKENLPAALALINCAGHNSAPKRPSSIASTGKTKSVVTLSLNCWEVFKNWTFP